MWQILFSLFFYFLFIVITVLCIRSSIWWPSRKPTFRGHCWSPAHFTCMTIWLTKRPFSTSHCVCRYVFAEERIGLLLIDLVSSFRHLYFLINNESLSQLLVELHCLLLLHHNKCNREENELNEKDLAQGACNVLDGATVRSEKNFLSISNIYVQIGCFIERVNTGCRVKGPANSSKRVRC